MVAGAAYWIILVAGILTGLSAFYTALTTRMVESVVLLPKLVTAAIILLVGAWLAQYLGRTVLVWAVNESFPFPHRWAVAVRASVFFVAVVVAAHALDFARDVFLAAFVIFAGGAVLACSLALGLGGRDAVQRFLATRAEQPERELEETLWKHI